MHDATRERFAKTAERVAALQDARAAFELAADRSRAMKVQLTFG